MEAGGRELPELGREVYPLRNFFQGGLRASFSCLAGCTRIHCARRMWGLRRRAMRRGSGGRRAESVSGERQDAGITERSINPRKRVRLKRKDSLRTTGGRAYTEIPWPALASGDSIQKR